MKIDIELTQTTAARFEKAAKAAGLTPEDYLAKLVAEKLDKEETK